MIIVPPITIDETNLNSTSVTNDEPDWSAGTYNLGDRVVEDKVVYEVVADPDTTDQPSVGVNADPPSWIRVGFSNRYRMFREGSDSKSTATGDITVSTTQTSVVNTVAFLGLVANEVTVTMTDSVEGIVYDETVSLVDIGAPDWYTFFFGPYELEPTALFLDLPPYPGADVDFVIDGATPSTDVECGRVVIGSQAELGATNYGTDVGIFDYSRKERDEFGTLTLVPRRTVSRVGYDVTIKAGLTDFVKRALARIAATPALFVGDPNFPSTVVFGVYRDFTIALTGIETSTAVIDVEGF